MPLVVSWGRQSESGNQLRRARLQHSVSQSNQFRDSTAQRICTLYSLGPGLKILEETFRIVFDHGNRKVGVYIDIYICHIST